ncbi:sulfurtransferase [Neiella sp. HB171785]|uniref:Sulfurtransferase n=1 Tax=Neiella litorisoli TaxID=2771431 RepID=A0A8J6UEM6_9GAMM|nr:sulfurtransferase [Neiella litorisoli]MBD1387826.1 sulfurtransferase [Neiella litorisoli]
MNKVSKEAKRSSLVTTEWLSEHLQDDDLVLFDASMATVVGIEAIEYDQQPLIPNSYKLDVEQELCDLSSSQLHALPTPAQFNAFAKRVGLSAESIVVVYDNQGIYSAPRAWWLLKVMGVDRVYVLNGGLPKWLAEKRATTTTYLLDSNQGTLQAAYQPQRVCDAAAVLAQLTDSDSMVVDARSAGRYQGSAPEPRAGLRSGHIPGSVNIHFAELLHERQMKPLAELEVIFDDQLNSKQQPLIASCGSGITACIVLLAAAQVGYQNLCLYDGSWTEWGADDQLPIE